MAGLKKPRGGASVKGEPTKAALPDRQAMESYLAALAGRSPQPAIDRAQDVIYQAWDAPSSRARLKLARKALAISPLCADAYTLLAEEATTAAEARELYARGVDAGALVLGPASFKDDAGHFWGILETRPYMRARLGLALTLQTLGEDEAAIEHFRAMLRLNPNDNQGMRYLLLITLLRRDDMPALKALLEDYDEGSTYWLYTQALIAYREDRARTAATVRLLKEARSVNPHVPGILAGSEPPEPALGDYITLGGADEASEYVRECGEAWRRTPGAVAWLASALTSRHSLKRRGSKMLH